MSKISSFSENATFFDTHQTANQEYVKNIPYANYMVGKLLAEFATIPSSLLEIGAGQGRFSIELSKHSKKVVSTDISPEAIKLLNKSATNMRIKNLHGVVMDAVSGKNFAGIEAIAGFLVLHHIDPSGYPNMAKYFRKIVKKGSRVCFIEPNRWCPYYLAAIAIRCDMPWEMEKGTYTNYLDRFSASMQENGFTSITRRVFGFSPPFLINRIPWIVKLDRLIERIPFLKIVLCPFEVVTFERT